MESSVMYTAGDTLLASVSLSIVTHEGGKELGPISPEPRKLRFVMPHGSGLSWGRTTDGKYFAFSEAMPCRVLLVERT